MKTKILLSTLLSINVAFGQMQNNSSSNNNNSHTQVLTDYLSTISSQQLKSAYENAGK